MGNREWGIGDGEWKIWKRILMLEKFILYFPIICSVIGVLMVKNSSIITYMDLDVWKTSHELVVKIYKITRDFPKEETYGLISQLRRGAYSIPSNIAEGNGKQYTKEYIQFLYIAKSSLNETRYFLFLSKDLDYIKENKYNELIGLLNQIEKMLMGLINSLKKKINA
jgi:four helix bundle protein